MAASPSTVLTLGLGSWGSVGLLTTLGFGIYSGLPAVAAPYSIDRSQAYSAGSVRGDYYAPGSAVGQARSGQDAQGDSF